MTTQEWASVAARLMSYWPQAKLTQTDIALWHDRLKDYPVEDVEAAIDRALTSGQEFLQLSTLIAGIELHRQGPAPGWREANRIIARHIRMLPYHSPQDGWADYVANLAEHHEAVARFAVALGVRGVREKPDPDYPQEDTGASVALTQLEREYRHTCDGWQADPQRGVALTEAKRQHRLSTAGDGMAAILEELRPAAQLPAGEEQPV